MYRFQNLKKIPAVMATFGEKLRYLREQNEMTQEELSAGINKKLPGALLNRNHVTNWENDRHLPTIDKTIAICDYFRVSLDDMLREKVTIRQMIQHATKKVKV